MAEGMVALASFNSYVEVTCGVNLAFAHVHQINGAALLRFQRIRKSIFESWRSAHCEPNTQDARSETVTRIERDWNEKENAYTAFSNRVVKASTTGANSVGIAFVAILALIGFIPEIMLSAVGATVIVSLGIVPSVAPFAFLHVYWKRKEREMRGILDSQGQVLDALKQAEIRISVASQGGPSEMGAVSADVAAEARA